MNVSFFVTGDPKAQPRPRAFARRVGNKVMVRAYDPGSAEGWKSQVALGARHHRPPQPSRATMSVMLTFFFRRPASHFKGKTRILRPDAPRQHCTKPDTDNLAKAVLDALTTVGMWQDDKQVYSLHVMKLYSDGDVPGCFIQIWEDPCPPPLP